MNKYREVPETIPASGNGEAAVALPRRKRVGSVKRVWIVLRKRLVGSSAFKSALVWSLAHGLRFINLTNPMLAGSRERVVEQSQYAPAIAALCTEFSESCSTSAPPIDQPMSTTRLAPCRSA